MGDLRRARADDHRRRRVLAARHLAWTPMGVPRFGPHPRGCGCRQPAPTSARASTVSVSLSASTTTSSSVLPSQGCRRRRRRRRRRRAARQAHTWWCRPSAPPSTCSAVSRAALRSSARTTFRTAAASVIGGGDRRGHRGRARARARRPERLPDAAILSLAADAGRSPRQRRSLPGRRLHHGLAGGGKLRRGRTTSGPALLTRSLHLEVNNSIAAVAFIP